MQGKGRGTKVLWILIIIAVLVGLIFGLSNLRDRKKKTDAAKETALSFMKDLKAGDITSCKKACPKDSADAVSLTDFDPDQKMVDILTGLGYQAGDGAASDFSSLLSSSGMPEDNQKKAEKLKKAMGDKVLVSYQVKKDGIEIKKDTVTIPVALKGILHLSELDFKSSTEEADKALADKVQTGLTAYMDYLDSSNLAGQDGGALILDQLKNEETGLLFDAMTDEVKDTKAKNETWNFTVQVKKGGKPKLLAISKSQT